MSAWANNVNKGKAGQHLGSSRTAMRTFTITDTLNTTMTLGFVLTSVPTFSLAVHPAPLSCLPLVPSMW